MIDLIPAIDLIGGRCVRLSQGDYAKKKAYGDPLEMARLFEDHGMKRLHLVDLDGAREKRVVNYRVLEQIAGKTSLVIDAGGGLRTGEDLRIVFESGARMATGGSIAVRNRPAFLDWLQSYGPDRIILGADFREGMIAVGGWMEETSLELLPFIQDYMKEGLNQVICTDIALDGMLTGPSFGVYRELTAACDGLRLIASGGISGLSEIEQLQEDGLHGVIIGKALYEGYISLKELENFILKQA